MGSRIWIVSLVTIRRVVLKSGEEDAVGGVGPSDDWVTELGRDRLTIEASQVLV